MKNNTSRPLDSTDQYFDCQVDLCVWFVTVTVREKNDNKRKFADQVVSW